MECKGEDFGTVLQELHVSAREGAFEKVHSIEILGKTVGLDFS
jgi:hypothetical protein